LAFFGAHARRFRILVVVHDFTDTMVAAIVHAADIQDRDGAPRLLRVVRSAFPRRHVFADSAYAGGKLQNPGEIR
jgi:hypothetical protein